MRKKLIWLLILALAVVWFFFYGGKGMVMKFFYPMQYSEYVEKYSKEYELDKYLVYAVINTESKFDEKAVSGAGAVGLMQLMEETAKDCNEKGELGYDIPRQLSEAEANIEIGCYYLKYLKDKFGEIELALMAYNGGPDNVESWLEDVRYSDGEGGLKITPYEETNEYVKKVMKNYKRYKEIY